MPSKNMYNFEHLSFGTIHAYTKFTKEKALECRFFPISKSADTLGCRKGIGMDAETTKKIDEFGTMMLENGIKTNIETDVEKIRDSIGAMYRKYLDIKTPPKIVKVPSPDAAVNLVYEANNGELSKHSIFSKILFVNQWTYWVAYYHAGIHILGERDGVEEELINDLDEYYELTQNVYAILACDDTCIVIDYPIAIHIKDNDLEKFQLHNPNGKAVEYKDGTGMYCINDIEVPAYICDTPSDKLDVKKVMGEANVDIRREGLEKIGFERAIQSLNPVVLDTYSGEEAWENYELLEIDFGDKPRICLKMYNPAQNKQYIERVADECETVLEALAFRDGESTYTKPRIIT